MGDHLRLGPGAGGVLLLLGLLTWLLLRGLDTNVAAYAMTLRTFDDFALAEASLHRDVLQARTGLLRDYDSLVAAEQAMDDGVDRLRSYARAEGLEAGAVERLAATVAQEEELTERFKSANALLQNSLSYVGLLSTGPIFGAQDAQLAPITGALAAAILHLTSDTSPEAAKTLQDEIDRFAAQAPAAGREAAAAQALLAHARLLRGLLPVVDATLRALVALPGEQPLEETRALFSRHHSAVEATARHFRLLLYLVSLLLIVLLVRLGVRLRVRALTLRRRAAFEHIIAENSTRLINCPPAETEARLQQVLCEIGRAIGVERAYVVFDERPARAITWSLDGLEYPPGWPDHALALSAQLVGAELKILTVPDVAGLPAGEVKDALAAAGVRGWAAVPFVRPDQVRALMGFDAFRPAWRVVFPLPVVQLAGDAVANAIRREFLERDRARLASRLERADRMQVIGSLASGIAHNFNNIIGAILGYSEMIEPELAPGTRTARYIEEIRRAAERGRDLVDNILTFGRRRDGGGRRVQVRGMLEETASMLHASLPSDVELIVQDIPVGVAVSGEPAQLQQIVLNLCTNAAQAMEGGGRIHVTAEQKVVTAPSRVSHGELAPGRYVCLAVSDTGRGFDEATAQQLFEPFFTTRATGTGLGLATVHEIVRDHDGAMNVQSKPGHGSRFEAWLPAAATDGAAEAMPGKVPLGRGEAVLLVESERHRLLRDEEMLAALGYEPVGFESAEEAIAACRSAPDRFDILLVSRASQDKGGLGPVHVLHKTAPRQPLILATVSSSDLDVAALAEAGIVEILRWPLVNTEVAAALARCARASNLD
ncbi:MAG TPA: two-component system VirA-like sensor kinase [Acetobacteraceae bacterium]|nr:two-component system VirA-like sensor kinase [Acetobacteraceae bacterium]